MEISITKMSKNGQIVIPVNIREVGNINPSTKFLIFNQDGDILLKQIREDSLIDDIDLIKKIEKSEEEIKNGKFINVSNQKTEEEIDFILMK